MKQADKKPQNKKEFNAKESAVKLLQFATQHRFVLIAAVVGIALSFALLKTRSALDISRNEDRYTEGFLQINYKEINSETLESFRLAEQDSATEVNSNFDPNRQNPFAE